MKKLFVLAAVIALTACSGMGAKNYDTSGSGDSGRSGASSSLGKQNESGAPATNVK